MKEVDYGLNLVLSAWTSFILFTLSEKYFLLQVNLKRKHWDPKASQSRSSKRCTEIFNRQMARAQHSSGQLQGAVTKGNGKGSKPAKALKPWQLKQRQQAEGAAQVRKASALVTKFLGMEGTLKYWQQVAKSVMTGLQCFVGGTI